MAHDTTDSTGFAVNSTGDLFDVASTAPTIAKSKLLWDVTDSEYKVVAPSAAIIAATDAATTMAQLNTLLIACRAQGIILP